VAKELKILYVSWHSVLEAEELSLFAENGWYYLSLGSYYNPYEVQGTTMRPPPPKEFNLWDELKGDYSNRDCLTTEQISPFDIIIYMHEPNSEQPQIVKAWPNIKHKKIIYRSIGQSISLTEKSLAPLRKEGLLVVRYSPKEETIPNYCGSDALIRFYKDPEEFKDWNGNTKRVITVGQSMRDRRGSCNYDAFVKATDPFERRLYGPGNENTGLIGRLLSYEDLKKEYRDNRVYFYTGTQPASYTLNFIEAMMTGVPIVALGPKHCNRDYPEQQTYEIPEIIKNFENGFWSDDISELQQYIKMLMEDDELAKRISENGRKTAIELFSKEKIKNDWKNFIEGLFKEESVI